MATLNGSSSGVARCLTPLLQTIGIDRQLEREAEAHANSSRTTRPTEADLTVLDAFAESVVRQIPSVPFDPASNAADAVREREHKKDLDERTLEEATVVEADAQLRNRIRDQAATDKGLTRPDAGRLQRLLFVAALALSFAPTFRDELFLDIADASLAWFFAIACSLIPAAMIVWATLRPNASGRREWANWLGLTAALGFGVANLIVRESNPEPNHLLALGLTGWEMTVVIFLEAFAQTLRIAYAEWGDQEAAKLATAARRRAAEDQLASAQERLEAREQRIADYIAYLDARAILHARQEDVIAAAKAAVQQVYRKKVNENIGIRIGADWRAA